MGNQVVHFEIIGQDGTALKAFYGELFGWTIDSNNPMDYGSVAPEDAGLGGGIAGAPEGYDGHLTIYVQVDDCETALAKAEGLGAERLMGPDEVPGVGIIIGQVKDPNGNVLGILQQKNG
jgi:uncharacterized protein